MLLAHCPDEKRNIEGKEGKELGFRPHSLCSVTALHHTLRLLRIPHGHDVAHWTAENQGDGPNLKVAEVRFKSRDMRLQMRGWRAQMQSFGAQMQRSLALRQFLEMPLPANGKGTFSGQDLCSPASSCWRLPPRTRLHQCVSGPLICVSAPGWKMVSIFF